MFEKGINEVRLVCGLMPGLLFSRQMRMELMLVIAPRAGVSHGAVFG
jgi:hypothetical protein